METTTMNKVYKVFPGGFICSIFVHVKRFLVSLPPAKVRSEAD